MKHFPLNQRLCRLSKNRNIVHSVLGSFLNLHRNTQERKTVGWRRPQLDCILIARQLLITVFMQKSQTLTQGRCPGRFQTFASPHYSADTDRSEKTQTGQNSFIFLVREDECVLSGVVCYHTLGGPDHRLDYSKEVVP